MGWFSIETQGYDWNECQSLFVNLFWVDEIGRIHEFIFSTHKIIEIKLTRGSLADGLV